MVDLVDMGDYQAAGLVDLVDKEGLDLLPDLQVLKVLLSLLLPMEEWPLKDFLLVGFSEEALLSWFGLQVFTLIDLGVGAGGPFSAICCSVVQLSFL